MCDRKIFFFFIEFKGFGLLTSLSRWNIRNPLVGSDMFLVVVLYVLTQSVMDTLSTVPYHNPILTSSSNRSNGEVYKDKIYCRGHTFFNCYLTAFIAIPVWQHKMSSDRLPKQFTNKHLLRIIRPLSIVRRTLN